MTKKNALLKTKDICNLFLITLYYFFFINAIRYFSTLEIEL